MGSNWGAAVGDGEGAGAWSLMAPHHNRVCWHSKLHIMAVFDFFSRKKRSPEDQEQRANPVRVGGVGEKSSYEASTRTNLPLNEFMTRLMAQELPILDSTSRQRVNDILRSYDGPEITSVEELPEEIRQIMELY